MYVLKVYDDKDRPCVTCGGQFERIPEKHLFRCKNCGVYMKAYVLTPKQQASKDIILSGEYSVVFDIGGKAAGKTFKNGDVVVSKAAELLGVYKFYVGAITISQSELAFMEVWKKIPNEWIVDSKTPKESTAGYMDLINGVYIIFGQTKDPGAIKSQSYFLIWMLEVTEGKEVFYNELLYRSRGDTDLGIKAAGDGLMLFETNSPDKDKPEQFFIIPMFWDKSSRIYFSEETYTPPDIDEVNPEYVTLVYDSDDNKENTSERFRRRAFENKSIEEVNAQKKGYVLKAGHRLLPLTAERVIESKFYQVGSPWWAALDYGITDAAVINFFYIDILTYQIVQFHETAGTGMELTIVVAKYFSIIAHYGLLPQYQYSDTVACLKMFQTECEGRDIVSKWRDNGVSLIRSPIYAVFPKLYRLHRLMEDNMFFIQQHCKVTIKEHTNYKGVMDKSTKRVKAQPHDDHTCETNRNAMSILAIEVDATDYNDRYKKFKSQVDLFMARARLKGNDSSTTMKGTIGRLPAVRVPKLIIGRRRKF